MDVKSNMMILAWKLIYPGTKISKIDKTSFLSSLLGFSPSWDYKKNNDYVSQKNTDLSTIDNIHLEAYCIDGSVLNGIRNQYYIASL